MFFLFKSVFLPILNRIRRLKLKLNFSPGKIEEKGDKYLVFLKVSKNQIIQNL